MSESILTTFKQIRDQLEKLNIHHVRKLLDTELIDEKNDLIDLYNAEVKPLPKGDPVKLEILMILADLGIYPCKLPSVQELIENAEKYDNYTKYIE